MNDYFVHGSGLVGDLRQCVFNPKKYYHNSR